MKNRKNLLRRDAKRSLFGEILDWMLAPLLFIWPISIAVTHYFANTVASYPYDQALRESVLMISHQIHIEPGVAPAIYLTHQARLNPDEANRVFFHISEKNGNTIAGTKLPWDESLAQIFAGPLGKIRFRNTELDGEPLRVAYSLLTNEHTGNNTVLIEVGETLNKRSELANKIITSVILPQFLIIPLAIILVWFGLSRGLRSLTRLRAMIEARRQEDLSPISKARVPEELIPLIDAFNAMLDRMKDNMDTQQRFIADAAHQMRTPLAGLKTQAQLAMQEENPEALHHELAQITSGVDRASHLVNQLLALARAESGTHMQASLPLLDLKSLLRQIVEDWVIRALAKQIDLGLEAKDPIYIKGHAFLLQEMINNLIDNAIRYTPKGGRVTCRLCSGTKTAILDIEDNGIGISKEDAEHVFKRFYRVNDALTQGSGLGLSIVQEIVEKHNGTATLLPVSEGKGTIARIVFPVADPESSASIQPEANDSI